MEPSPRVALSRCYNNDKEKGPNDIFRNSNRFTRTNKSWAERFIRTPNRNVNSAILVHEKLYLALNFRITKILQQF